MNKTQHASFVTKYFPNRNPEKSGSNDQAAKNGQIHIALHTTKKEKRMSVTSVQECDL
jgi:hypothetical protein